MAAELKATNPAVNIEILGVNRSDASEANYLVTLYRKLPWLQDTITASAWEAWEVIWRDVQILDSQNNVYAIYNLTSHDLADASNRATLKGLFLEAARFRDIDRDQLFDDWEFYNFGTLVASPMDDPDRDGQNNFTEYAFGTNPNDANSQNSFVPWLSGAGTNRHFVVTFRRRAGGCIDYLIDTAPEIAPWAGSMANMNLFEPFKNFYDGNGIGQTSCSFPAPRPGQPRGYIRVRAVPRPSP